MKEDFINSKDFPRSVRGPSSGSTPYQYIQKLIAWAASPDAAFIDDKQTLWDRREFARGQIECLGNWGFISYDEQKAFIFGLRAAQDATLLNEQKRLAYIKETAAMNAEFDAMNRSIVVGCSE